MNTRSSSLGVRAYAAARTALVLLLAQAMAFGAVPAEAYAEGLDIVADASDQALVYDSDAQEDADTQTEAGVSDEEASDEVELSGEDAVEEAAGAEAESGAGDAESADAPEVVSAQASEQLKQIAHDKMQAVREQASEGKEDIALLREVYIGLVKSELDEESRLAVLSDEVPASVSEAQIANEAMSALDDEPTTPAGIACAFEFTARELGFEVTDVVGADDSLWYLVKVNEAWYHVDPASEVRDYVRAKNGSDGVDEPSLAWLLVSDEEVGSAFPERMPWNKVDDSEESVPTVEESFDWDAYGEDSQGSADPDEQETLGEDEQADQLTDEVVSEEPVADESVVNGPLMDEVDEDVVAEDASEDEAPASDDAAGEQADVEDEQAGTADEQAASADEQEEASDAVTELGEGDEPAGTELEDVDVDIKALEDALNSDSLITNSEDKTLETTQYALGSRSFHIPAKLVEDENADPVASQASLPSSYDSRTEYLVTRVKDQNPYGSCWSFAAMAALESSILKRGGTRGLSYTASSLDLSERHLAYFTYNSVNDPLGNTAGDATVAIGDSYLDLGGNTYIASHVLANWYGPVAESVAPYSDLPIDSYYLDSSYNLSNSYAYSNRVALVTGVRFVAMSERNKVKNAVMDYGAAVTSIYYSDSYLSSSNGAFYNPSIESTNHDVTIVGWDDNFPRTSFLSLAEGNGAWLIKNSWGTSFADGGYFWVSYYDKALNMSDSIATVYDAFGTTRYRNNYHYDGSGNPSSIGIDSGGQIAAVYTTKGGSKGERLKAVSFELDDTNVDYSIQIYANLTSKSKPTSGSKMLASPIKGKTNHAGQYTVNLPNPIPLPKNTTYSVVVTFSHASNSYVHVGADSTQSWGWVSFTSSASKNQTFYRDSTSRAWDDCTELGSGATMRLKVFSVNADLSKETNVANLSVSKVSAQKLIKGGCKPNPTVKYGNLKLRKGTDYTISYKNNTKVGTASLIIKGKGQYSGTKTVKFKIIFPDVPTSHWGFAVVHRAAQLKLVNGYAKCNFGPNDKITRGQVAVILWNMAGKPKAGSGAKYFSDVRSGQYFYNAVRWASSVGVVSGVGNNRFKPNANVTREQLAVMICNYARQVKGLTTKGSASDYASMRDSYRVSKYARASVGWCFKNKVMSGSKGRILPQNNATRAEAAKMLLVLYDLKPASTNLKDATLTLSKTSYVYSGSAFKPGTTVKLNGRTLTKGTDYTVSYKNNVNKGTATVTVKGKGSYKGSMSKTFKIIARSVSGASVAKITNKTYTANPIRPTPAVKVAGRTLKKGTDYTLSYKGNVNVGTATITITGRGNYKGSKSVTFKIVKRNLSTGTLALPYTSIAYNGTARKPNTTVKCAGRTLKRNIDYTVSYKNNVNVGTATVTVAGKGNYSGSKSAKFKIVEPKELAAAVLYETGELVLSSGTVDLSQPNIAVWSGASTVANHLWTGSDYASSVTKVTVKDYVYIESGSSFFYGLSNLASANLTKLDTSRCTSFASMFYGCSSLKSVSGIWAWDTKNVTDMSYMFSGCNSITTLKPASWDTSKVTSMSHMFTNCWTCDNWSLNGLDTSSVTSMWSMFESCTNLGKSQSFNLSKWNTSNNRDFDRIFFYCPSLTTYNRDLKVSGWDTSSKVYMTNTFDSDYPYKPAWYGA